MNLMICGGAGFIGSNFIHLVMRERPDWRILNFDALTYAGNLSNLDAIALDKRYQFVHGDIADAAAVQSEIERFKPDAIINFAAETHVDRSIHGGAADFVRTNVSGTQTLLEAVRKNNIDRLVHISTDEVYGALPLEGGEPFTELTPFAPNSPYAASKAGGDLLCRAYFKTYGTPVMVTHASNNYGPYQFPEKLIPFMVMRAMADQSLPVYGDGMNIRDWLHVDDHASAILAVLEKGKAGEVYNIGADAERHNIDLVKMVLAMLGKPESLITYVADRPGHDRRYSVASTKIRKELGWKPKFDDKNFDVGLRQTVEWYKMHGDWIREAVDKSKSVNAHIK